MKIAVVTGGDSVLDWHRWTIEALEAVPAAEVRIVAAGSVPPGDVDVIVDLAGTAPAADPPGGVWLFRLGTKNTPSAPFAHEYGRGEPTFEIELIRRRGGTYERLRAGRFAAMPIYRNALRTALGHAARWPATFVAAAAAGIAAPATPASAPPAPAPITPFSRVRFALGLARRIGAALAEDAFEITEWNVGFLDGDARALVAGAPLRARWLDAPAPLTFVADPFVVRRDGKRALLVEEFSYGRDRGVLEAYTLDDADRIVSRDRILDLPTHLSYPYPIEIDGELYIMPENCAAKEVALYRCVDFPARWERETVVFADFDGVDTTIFPHEGRWWALCTRYSEGSTLALYAYHASSPRGPWQPHALNPIVTDVACARPGGQPFTVDGALYRPAQDCTGSYGSALSIMRVDRLTPTEFAETLVRRIDARGLAPYCEGIHTLSFDGERLVIDGKRVYRRPSKLSWSMRRMRARLARLARRRSVAERPQPALTRP